MRPFRLERSSNIEICRSFCICDIVRKTNSVGLYETRLSHSQQRNKRRLYRIDRVRRSLSIRDERRCCNEDDLSKGSSELEDLAKLSTGSISLLIDRSRLRDYHQAARSVHRRPKERNGMTHAVSATEINLQLRILSSDNR